MSVDRVRRLVDAVPDPELPHVTIGDLGMVRSVRSSSFGIVVEITPTYTGCPATEAIVDAVRAAIGEAGYGPASVEMVLDPPWTTDDITEQGREKLRKAGIAPPPEIAGDLEAVIDLPAPCPRCHSRRTRRLGDFGATACKAPHVCQACGEPFELFKPI